MTSTTTCEDPPVADTTTEPVVVKGATMLVAVTSPRGADTVTCWPGRPTRIRVSAVGPTAVTVRTAASYGAVSPLGITVTSAVRPLPIGPAPVRVSRTRVGPVAR